MTPRRRVEPWPQNMRTSISSAPAASPFVVIHDESAVPSGQGLRLLSRHQRVAPHRATRAVPELEHCLFRFAIPVQEYARLRTPSFAKLFEGLVSRKNPVRDHPALSTGVTFRYGKNTIYLRRPILNAWEKRCKVKGRRRSVDCPLASLWNFDRPRDDLPLVFLFRPEQQERG